jgi:hypothetical protein
MVAFAFAQASTQSSVYFELKVVNESDATGFQTAFLSMFSPF